MTKEYAVYRGEEILVIGTKEECAAKLGVQPQYIYWLTTKANQRRLAKQKNPDEGMIAIVLDEDDEE